MKLKSTILTVFICFSFHYIIYGQLESVPSGQKISTNINDVGQRYNRSSISIMVLDVAERQYASDIKSAFLKQTTPDKFDDHTIPLRYIPVDANPSRVEELGFQIERYLNNDIGAGKMMVAKWFNRNEYGQMDMDLIAKRGLYNATDLDVKTALASKVGMGKIQDAGETLLKNSFIAVYSFRIVNKENIAKATGAGLKIAGSIMSIATNNNTWNNVGNIAGTVAENVRGFTCFIDVYLYQLDWNDAVASTFYNEYWNTDASREDLADKFEKSRLFNVKYISKSSSTSDVTGFTVDGKDNVDRIADLMKKTLPKGLMALEGGNTQLATGEMVMEGGLSQFRVRTNVVNDKPIKAKIGLKEGLKFNDLFILYEKKQSSNGAETLGTGTSAVEYKPVGSVRVKAGKVWDNRFVATGKDDDANLTQFYQVQGKTAYKGMLVQQLKQNKFYYGLSAGTFTRTGIFTMDLIWGHSFKFGLGAIFVADKFNEEFTYNGFPFLYKYNVESIGAYAQLAQNLVINKSFYVEPFFKFGYSMVTGDIKRFYSPDNGNYVPYDYDANISGPSTFTDSKTAYSTYLDGGLRWGYTYSPIGHSIYLQTSYTPSFTYKDLSVGSGEGNLYGYENINLSKSIPFNIAVGIVWKSDKNSSSFSRKPISVKQ